MMHIKTQVEQPPEEGINFRPIAVTLFFFVTLWFSTGVDLSLTPENVVNVSRDVYSDLESRFEGNASIFQELTWVCIGLFGLVLNFVNRRNALLVWTKAWPLLVIFALIAMSIFWSSVPDVTLRRVVKHLLLMAAVSGIAIEITSPRELVRLAVLFTGFIMTMNFATVLLFPARGTDVAGSFVGLHDHKNTAGMFSMLAIFVWLAAARWFDGAWIRAILFFGIFVWFVFLLGTDSRTSVICTLAAVAFVIPFRYLIRRVRTAVIVLLAMLFVFLCTIFVVIGFNISLSDMLAFIEGERTTLSGRSLVWQIAYEAYLQHPLLGTGYRSLWSAGSIPVEEYSNLPLTDFLVGLTQAHNGYMDVLATLGLPGAVTLFILLTSAIWFYTKVASTSENDENALLIEFSGFILIGSLIYNITQSIFLNNGIFWVFFILCYMSLCSVKSSIKDGSVLESESMSVPEAGRAHRISRIKL